MPPENIWHWWTYAKLARYDPERDAAQSVLFASGILERDIPVDANER